MISLAEFLLSIGLFCLAAAIIPLVIQLLVSMIDHVRRIF